MNGSTPTLHARLWAENEHLARASLESAFVQGLGDGSLDPEAFKRYVAQDAFFLKAFFAAYALAAARAASDTSIAARLVTLMGGVLEELELHSRYASSLDIDLETVEPNAAATAYTEFLLETGWQRDVGEILAAMTPCMRLYAWIGRALSDRVGPDNRYSDWIETYASEEFEGLAVELEHLLDLLAKPSAAVEAAYARAMQCEVDFFEAFA